MHFSVRILLAAVMGLAPLGLAAYLIVLLISVSQTVQ